MVNLRGGALTPKAKNPAKRVGEPSMLNDFDKEPLDTIDLDDVKVGHNREGRGWGGSAGETCHAGVRGGGGGGGER